MSKRLLAILLCLAMLLSLAACGQDGDNSNTKPQPNKEKPKVETLSPDAEPTDEEWYQIRKYNGIADALNHFEDEKSFKYFDSENNVKYYGQEALAFCYEQLQQLSELEKWNNTKWAADYGVSIDCQSLMERFTVSQMIKETYTEYDKLGNVSEPSDGGLWVYDTEGRLVSAQPSYFWDTLLNETSLLAFTESGIRYTSALQLNYIYNEDGTIEKYQQVDSDGTIQVLITPEYDANGMMVSATAIDSRNINYTTEPSLSFTYDAQGRYAKVTYTEENSYNDTKTTNTWDFSYDDEGKILKKVCNGITKDSAATYTSESTAEYTFQYTADGFLSNAVASATGGERRTYEYTCDDGGRPCKVVIRDDHSALDRVEVEVEYGYYYIYNPTK